MIYSDVTTYFLGTYFINTTIYVVSAPFLMNRIEDFVDGMVDQHSLLFCQVLFALSFKTEVIFLTSVSFFDCNSFNDSMQQFRWWPWNPGFHTKTKNSTWIVLWKRWKNENERKRCHELVLKRPNALLASHDQVENWPLTVRTINGWTQEI